MKKEKGKHTAKQSSDKETNVSKLEKSSPRKKNAAPKTAKSFSRCTVNSEGEVIGPRSKKNRVHKFDYSKAEIGGMFLHISPAKEIILEYDLDEVGITLFKLFYAEHYYSLYRSRISGRM